MAGQTRYLIRANKTYVQFSHVTAVSLTGATQSYSTVTGVEATNTLSIPANTLVNGESGFFQSIAGGGGLATDTTYWVINTSGNDFQLSLTPGGAAINFTTDITSGVFVVSPNDQFVWSTEYRNQFQSTIRVLSGTSLGASIPSMEINAPAILEAITNSLAGGVGTSTPTYGEFSDEVASVPLRQDPLRKTFWKFTVEEDSVSSDLLAEFLAGDAVSNNPPNTVVAVTA